MAALLLLCVQGFRSWKVQGRKVGSGDQAELVAGVTRGHAAESEAGHGSGASVGYMGSEAGFWQGPSRPSQGDAACSAAER